MWSAVLPGIMGFAGGAVVATAINAVVGWLNRPIIMARIVEGAGCYVKTSRGNPPSHDAMFLRLQIKNRGKSSVIGCAAYVTRITRKQPGTKIDDAQEVLTLHWANSSEASVDIPRGAFFYLDVASLDCVPGHSVLGIGADLPNNIAGIFGTPGQFDLQILIAASNAKPVQRRVVFGYDPSKSDLEHKYDPAPLH
jgi:hypothetical protein